MSALLVSLDGHADIPLDRGLVVVGRYHRCDVRLSSQRISRHHCCLSPEGDEVVVRDLDSTNGTFLNGQRIQLGRLRDGDELRIAQYCYRLVADPGPPATRPPSPTPVPTEDDGMSTALDASPLDGPDAAGC